MKFMWFQKTVKALFSVCRLEGAPAISDGFTGGGGGGGGGG